jgi:hypothetical protein
VTMRNWVGAPTCSVQDGVGVGMAVAVLPLDSSFRSPFPVCVPGPRLPPEGKQDKKEEIGHIASLLEWVQRVHDSGGMGSAAHTVLFTTREKDISVAPLQSLNCRLAPVVPLFSPPPTPHP